MLIKKYEVIPFSELRRQYRRERQIKNNILSTAMLVLWSMAFTAYYLFS